MVDAEFSDFLSRDNFGTLVQTKEQNKHEHQKAGAVPVMGSIITLVATGVIDGLVPLTHCARRLTTGAVTHWYDQKSGRSVWTCNFKEHFTDMHQTDTIIIDCQSTFVWQAVKATQESLRVFWQCDGLKRACQIVGSHPNCIVIKGDVLSLRNTIFSQNLRLIIEWPFDWHRLWSAFLFGNFAGLSDYTAASSKPMPKPLKKPATQWDEFAKLIFDYLEPADFFPRILLSTAIGNPGKAFFQISAPLVPLTPHTLHHVPPKNEWPVMTHTTQSGCAWAGDMNDWIAYRALHKKLAPDPSSLFDFWLVKMNGEAHDERCAWLHIGDYRWPTMPVESSWWIRRSALPFVDTIQSESNGNILTRTDGAYLQAIFSVPPYSTWYQDYEWLPLPTMFWMSRLVLQHKDVTNLPADMNTLMFVAKKHSPTFEKCLSYPGVELPLLQPQLAASVEPPNNNANLLARHIACQFMFVVLVDGELYTGATHLIEHIKLVANGIALCSGDANYFSTGMPASVGYYGKPTHPCAVYRCIWHPPPVCFPYANHAMLQQNMAYLSNQWTDVTNDARRSEVAPHGWCYSTLNVSRLDDARASVQWAQAEVAKLQAQKKHVQVRIYSDSINVGKVRGDWASGIGFV